MNKPFRVYSAQQYNLFSNDTDEIPVILDDIPLGETHIENSIAFVKNSDSSRVIISGFGIYLSKKSERLVIKKDKKSHFEIPFFRINELIVYSRGISLSTDLIEEICLRGINLYFLSGGGKPYAMITSPILNASVETKKCQIDALNNEKSHYFARAVILGKITNQERLLRYYNKYLKSSHPERHKKIENIVKELSEIKKTVSSIKGKNIDESRNSLMGIEGKAGKLYWSGVKEILRNKIEFFGRETRSAIDPVNSLLNYGYGILYSIVWGTVLNAGLEPFAGFLHVDRSGKPSLVLDLTEEFRQPVVDKVVISYINLGQKIKQEDGLLDLETRKLFAEKINERLDYQENYSGKKHKIRSIIQLQARNLASFLRGKTDYKPFVFKW